MRYVAAYLLAWLGGKKAPEKKDVASILESIGLDVEDDKLDKVKNPCNSRPGPVCSTLFIVRPVH